MTISKQVTKNAIAHTEACAKALIQSKNAMSL